MKVKEGYSIFAVLGKKQRAGEDVVSYDSVKILVREDLLSEKMHARVDDYVASAARNYSVTLYYDRLKQLTISPTNMVTKRMIGFGGTMPASPGLMPVYRWVDKAAGVKQVFP